MEFWAVIVARQIINILEGFLITLLSGMEYLFRVFWS